MKKLKTLISCYEMDHLGKNVADEDSPAVAILRVSWGKSKGFAEVRAVTVEAAKKEPTARPREPCRPKWSQRSAKWFRERRKR